MLIPTAAGSDEQVRQGLQELLVVHIFGLPKAAFSAVLLEPDIPQAAADQSSND